MISLAEISVLLSRAATISASLASKTKQCKILLGHSGCWEEHCGLEFDCVSHVQSRVRYPFGEVRCITPYPLLQPDGRSARFEAKSSVTIDLYTRYLLLRPCSYDGNGPERSELAFRVSFWGLAVLRSEHYLDGSDYASASAPGSTLTGDKWLAPKVCTGSVEIPLLCKPVPTRATHGGQFYRIGSHGSLRSGKAYYSPLSRAKLVSTSLLTVESESATFTMNPRLARMMVCPRMTLAVRFEY